MAIIRKSEYEQMNEKVLGEKLVDLKKELMKYRSQRYSGTPPENPGRVREVRKTIARIYTKLTEKKMAETKEEIKTKDVKETVKKTPKKETKTKTTQKGKEVKSKV